MMCESANAEQGIYITKPRYITYLVELFERL